ncbi:MAG TPA: anti-sigma factor domain-containing protein [Bacillota bacterium]|nr:anti-sigma factor domain-containing protein [Bacillota bacterium]
MKKFKGIVTKISGNKCIILTSDGDFQRVPLPSGPVKVGQEISGRMSSGFTGLSRYATLAACLLLVIAGLFAIQLPASAEPAAYVSVDINPSLELAVDSAYKVIGFKALNEDAKRLMQDIEYENKDVYQVLSMVLQKAVDLQYVAPSKSNLVVSSVVELNPKVHLDTVKLQKAVAQPLKTSKIKVSVLFFKANKAEHDKANDLRLSTGKYILSQENTASKDVKLKVSAKRLKMVITDTTTWEEEPDVPASAQTPKVRLPQWDDNSDDDTDDTVRPGKQEHPGKAVGKARLRDDDAEEGNSTAAPSRYVAPKPAVKDRAEKQEPAEKKPKAEKSSQVKDYKSHKSDVDDDKKEKR